MGERSKALAWCLVALALVLVCSAEVEQPKVDEHAKGDAAEHEPAAAQEGQHGAKQEGAPASAAGTRKGEAPHQAKEESPPPKQSAQEGGQDAQPQEDELGDSEEFQPVAADAAASALAQADDADSDGENQGDVGESIAPNPVVPKAKQMGSPCPEGMVGSGKNCAPAKSLKAQERDEKDTQKKMHEAAKHELGEAVKAQEAKEAAEEIPAEVGVLGKGEAYIPLSPTIPKLTVLKKLTMKGHMHVDEQNERQFSVNGYADVSSTAAGGAVFGGNMHILNKKQKNEFRYSNTHGQIGGIGFAANFPHYNKASIVSSGTKASTKDASFKPKTVITFTGSGNVGVGVDGPASKLHVQGTGNSRLINVNHWGDVSACASGVGSFGSNAYVTTEGNKATFRYSNAHSGMGAIGMATNFPDWNKVSIVTSGTTASEAKKVFTPKPIATFTHRGFMGIGTTDPKSALAVTAAGRQISVDSWLDVSSQGSAGFIGLNAHMIKKGNKRFFAFSNTAKDLGAIGVATNFPMTNQLSIVSSTESASTAGTLFKPQSIATFTRDGNVGFGTDAPKAKLDVRHATDRQISANKFADMSANEQLQGFFGGNGYAVGQGFNFANTNGVAGAIGLATHYPKAGQAAIISSGSVQPKAGASFKPMVLAQFQGDGSMSIPKNLVVAGDIKVLGRVINGDKP